MSLTPRSADVMGRTRHSLVAHRLLRTRATALACRSEVERSDGRRVLFDVITCLGTPSGSACSLGTGDDSVDATHAIALLECIRAVELDRKCCSWRSICMNLPAVRASSFAEDDHCSQCINTTGRALSQLDDQPFGASVAIDASFRV